jgi:HlyD family secretion protein
MKINNFFKRIATWSNNHRIYAGIIIIVIAFVGYYIIHSALTPAAVPQYTLSIARMGSITQTVTGSGQVSASNQTDILSQSSGTITSIPVSVGESVYAGQLIATIDSTNAAITLENAKISYAKVTQPAKNTDVSLSQNTLAKAYDSGWNTVAGIFLDLPNIMTGMKDMLYGQTGFLSDQSASYLNSTARPYRDAAGVSYDAAVNQYQKTLLEYKNLTRSSATSSIDTLLADTYSTIKSIAEAATKTQTAANFIISTQPEYQKSSASSALTNSFSTLLAGSDPLDVQSAKLSLEQAQRTYDNYFVRAPYSGIIGRIPVNVFGQAGSGTTIATIVGQKKIASISLNEVDAAKVKVGQTVKITFDAIDGLNATGTVSVVDQIGAVSSGVVSYGVKIAIDTEDVRIKPGMSVNTTIITLQKDNVLVIPSSAVKKLGQASYVQTLDQSVIQSIITPAQTSINSNQNNFATSGQNSSTTLGQNFSSSTRNRNLGSTTGTFAGSPNMSSGRSITIGTAVTPTNVTITTGDSDDTNIEITSGLTRGQFIITKTSAASTAQTSTAPSILSGIGGGGNRNAAGAVRTTGARIGN